MAASVEVVENLHPDKTRIRRAARAQELTISSKSALVDEPQSNRRHAAGPKPPPWAVRSL